MADFGEHVALSAVASTGTYLAMCRYYGRQPQLGELLVCEGLGVLAGAAPDVLEPATNPNHRAVGHSLALGTALAKFAIMKCSRENPDWQEFLKVAATVAIVSYVVHLLADGLTAKGLPLLGS